MRTPYTYGYASDPSFTPNRPGLELWRGNECDNCGPGGVVNRGDIRMAGVTPVPSGTYMGPVGKVVHMNGTRGMAGYGYSSGPGIPDAVAIAPSPTSRAFSYMSNLGIATRGQRGVARLSGAGLGDGVQDRALCQGITTAIGAAGTGARDINATPGTGGRAATRDPGWNQAGQYIAAVGGIGAAFCSLIQTGQTPVQTQPQGTLTPPGYTYPPSGYIQGQGGGAPAQTGLPAWAIPAGIAAVVAIVGAVVILK